MVKIQTYRNIEFEIRISLNTPALLNLNNELKHHIVCSTTSFRTDERNYYKSYSCADGVGNLGNAIMEAESDFQKWVETVTTGEERYLLKEGFKFN